MKSILVKLTPEQAKTYQGVVFAPAMADLDDLEPGEYAVTLSGTGKAIRTNLQNNSIHKYWDIICQMLNDSGWTKKKYYEVKEVDIEWTPESVGDDIWRGIQEAMYGHRKTSKLDTAQVSKIHEVMDRHLSTTCGEVSAPFPSKDSMMNAQLGMQ